MKQMMPVYAYEAANDASHRIGEAIAKALIFDHDAALITKLHAIKQEIDLICLEIQRGDYNEDRED